MSPVLGSLVSALALSPLLGVSQLFQLALGESSNSCPAYHPVIFDISKLHPNMRLSLHEGMAQWLNGSMLHGPCLVSPISSSNGTKPLLILKNSPKHFQQLLILNNTQKHFQQLQILNHTKHYHTFFSNGPPKQTVCVSCFVSHRRFSRS